VVLLLLPCSFTVDDGEFDHGGGGGGGGGLAARQPGGSGSGRGGGGGGGLQLVAKAAGNKSVNGRMMSCNDKSGRQTTMQQPTK
jgi:hypothetical protein